MKENIKNEKKLISKTEEFDNLIKEKNTFLVLFSSDSCGYCQLAEKNINKVIESFEKIDFYQLKLADTPEVFRRYDINSVPVLKIFRAGEAVYTGFGVRTPNDIYYQLKNYFQTKNSYSEDDSALKNS